jgi:hypothetical protein
MTCIVLYSIIVLLCSMIFYDIITLVLCICVLILYYSVYYHITIMILYRCYSVSIMTLLYYSNIRIFLTFAAHPMQQLTTGVLHPTGWVDLVDACVSRCTPEVRLNGGTVKEQCFVPCQWCQRVGGEARCNPGVFPILWDVFRELRVLLEGRRNT